VNKLQVGDEIEIKSEKMAKKKAVVREVASKNKN